MPSVKRTPRLAVLVLCGALGAGSLAGCETTQEKAAAHRAESERILEARAKRQRHHGSKSQNAHADGTNSQARKDRSARRHSKGDKTARGERGEG